MYEELVKQLREATGWENASVHYSLMNEAANAIESLVQENSFLKLMQQQLTKDIPENELGKKVYNTLKCVDSNYHKKNQETEEN